MTSTRLRISLIVLISGTGIGLLLPLPSAWRLFLAFLLIAVWPAYTWYRWQVGPWQERVVTAAALALLVNAMATLLLAYLPGSVPAWSWLVYVAVAVLPLLQSGEREETRPLPVRRIGLPLLLIMLLTIILRGWHLGYSEFQGDEGVILTRAAAAITGDGAELFLHQKGPMEILLPLAMWQLGGQLNEFWARLPFAWAGVLAVAAVYVLAHRWTGQVAALTATLLFTIVGFTVAFGRIVQYQSFVLVWGALAVLYALRYRESVRRWDLWGTAVFLAGGLLAHYDAALVAPAIGWLLARAIWGKQRIDGVAWVTALLVGGGTLAVFYVPFLLSPTFTQTSQYLLQDRIGAGGGHGLLGWSGPAVWRMVTFYNSTYFVGGLSLLLLIGLRQLRRKRRGVALLLFFATPLLFYLFVVADPRTHVYTFFPGAAILAGIGWQTVVKKVARRRVQIVGWGLLALFIMVSLSYVYLMVVDHTPERQRTWAQNRPSGYPVAWSEPPLYGLFGFPHQAGWRAAGELIDELPYASNEEEEITNWYMRQAARTHCANFETFVLAERAQDEIPYDPVWLEEMHLHYRVTVNGRLALQIYGREPQTSVQTVEATDKVLWLTPADATASLPEEMIPVNAVFGDRQVRLLGYTLDTHDTVPGGQTIVTLYWQALAPFAQNYQVFTHLYDGQLRAQHDGAPECAINPTTRWEPGQIIPDPHTISLPSDVESGSIPLLVGMYNLITQERLPVMGASTDALHLTDVVIRTGQRTPGDWHWVTLPAETGDYELQLGLYRPDTGERLPVQVDSGAAETYTIEETD